MAVVIRWTRTAWDRFEQWIGEYDSPFHDPRTVLSFYRDLIEGAIQQAKGIPPDAAPMPGVHPACWVWEFVQGRLWLILTKRGEQRGWLRRLFGATDRIVIERVFLHPPHVSDLTTPDS
jgi:hypothetical protein